MAVGWPAAAQVGARGGTPSCAAATPYRGAATPGCSGAAPSGYGLPAYQRWQDGTPAAGSSTPPGTADLPARGFSSVHDFGR